LRNEFFPKHAEKDTSRVRIADINSPGARRMILPQGSPVENNLIVTRISREK
jgi:hypothetical protein